MHVHLGAYVPVKTGEVELAAPGVPLCSCAAALVAPNPMSAYSLAPSSSGARPPSPQGVTQGTGEEGDPTASPCSPTPSRRPSGHRHPPGCLWQHHLGSPLPQFPCL